MSDAITFAVLGRPQPAGSKRAFAHKATGRIVVVDDAKGSRPWKQQVAGMALEAMAGRAPFTGPVEVEMVFVFARPKGHHGTGRNAGRVKASAPSFHTVKPDALKLARAVEDAMSRIVYADDSQIVVERLEKRYTHDIDTERVVVFVKALASSASRMAAA